jgi:hypothetical protein
MISKGGIATKSDAQGRESAPLQRFGRRLHDMVRQASTHLWMRVTQDHDRNRIFRCGQ